MGPRPRLWARGIGNRPWLPAQAARPCHAHWPGLRAGQRHACPGRARQSGGSSSAKAGRPVREGSHTDPQHLCMAKRHRLISPLRRVASRRPRSARDQPQRGRPRSKPRRRSQRCHSPRTRCELGAIVRALVGSRPLDPRARRKINSSPRQPSPSPSVNFAAGPHSKHSAQAERNGDNK